MRKLLALVVLGLAVPSAAHATEVLDDFNRADAATLGPNWTQQSGTSSISGNMATGTNLALATYDGSSGNAVSFDLFHGASQTTQYIAAVLGWGAGDNFFIKVQDNGQGVFNHFAFYTGNNSLGLFDQLSSTFTQATVIASYTGTVATLTINPLGGSQQIYTHDYGFTPTGTLNGLGFFGSALADNFGTGQAVGAVPEPATWAIMLLGFGFIGGAMRWRRRQRLTVSYI